MKRHAVAGLAGLMMACQPTGSPFLGEDRWFAEALAGCEPTDKAPTSVDDVIARINALPRPATVACFIASLPRPLTLVGSTSVFSAQPAAGPEVPRLFIFSGGVILSVVFGGTGAELLEIGEFAGDAETLKAEVVFPVEGEATRQTAYGHLAYSPAVTSCGLCHRAERGHPAHALARISLAFKPNARTLVALDTLRDLARDCDREAYPARCLGWAAVFDFGEVRAGAFPSAFADFP